MICLTIDTDWAPEEALAYTLDILHSERVKVTVFTTGRYRSLEKADKELVETGIHPNIKDPERAEETLMELLAVYPQAVSLRNHSLIHSSRFLPIYRKVGIKKTSNYLAPGVRGLAPIKFTGDLTECPIYFMDDYYLTTPGTDFTVEGLGLDEEGLKVLAFHPVHIYLNTSCIEDYEKAKPHLKDPEALAAHRRSGIGIDTLFRDLVAHLGTGKTYKLKEIGT